jgi:hypothetical protein
MEFTRLHPLNISGFSNNIAYSFRLHGNVEVSSDGITVVDSEYVLLNVESNISLRPDHHNIYRSPSIYVVERDTTEENVVETIGEDELIMRMTVGQLRMFINAEVTRLLGH